jgi:hypothetical protein
MKSMATLVLYAAFLHQYVPIKIPTQSVTKARIGQEYGPGVKRLDPGTVNLPFGACDQVSARIQRPTILWLMRTHRSK